MNSIVSFYNNLFTIEIAVFGIIAAAIFVFVQIVYSQFSYREIGLIFKNILLSSYIALSSISLIMTAAGSLILSFTKLNIVLGSIVIADIFRNEIFASAIVISLFLSLGLFVAFIFFNIRYIRPSKVALLISKQIKAENISNYLLRTYGVSAPDDWFSLIRLRLDIPSEDLDLVGNGGKRELSEEELENMEVEKKQRERKLLENMRIHEEIKKTVENTQDPLEPLDALIMKAIINSDLGTIREIQSVLLYVSDRFIEEYKYENQF